LQKLEAGVDADEHLVLAEVEACGVPGTDLHFPIGEIHVLRWVEVLPADLFELELGLEGLEEPYKKLMASRPFQR